MLALLIYFIPTIFALLFCSSKEVRLAVFLVNFFLGWTIIGWVVAMGLAILGDD